MTNPPVAELTVGEHHCPDCNTLCYCQRGQVNPKDGVHMECFSGVHDVDCDPPEQK